MEATNPKTSEGIATGTRCACDSIDCRWDDNHPDCSHWPNGGIPRCLKRADCVVVLRYPSHDQRYNESRPTPLRIIRLPMCRECTEWWTTHEHDGATATLQIAPEQKLVSQAAEAAEIFSEDELERVAEEEGYKESA